MKLDNLVILLVKYLVSEQVVQIVYFKGFRYLVENYVMGKDKMLIFNL